MARYGSWHARDLKFIAALDPHAKRLLDMLAAAAPPARVRLQPEERRAAFAALMQLGALPEPIGHVTDFSITGPGRAIPVRHYTPLQSLNEAVSVLIYFHGGGLVAGSLETHDAFCRTLAAQMGCGVLAVDYRLAPEHPFPAAVEDGCAAAAWILAHAAQLQCDSNRIGIAGDSAGASVAAVVCQSLMQLHPNGTKPALQLLLCPILDFGAQTESRQRFATGYLLDMDDVAVALEAYLANGASARDPRVSPLRTTDLSGLPRTYIHTAEFDPMRDEGIAYGERLSRAGVEVHHTCHAGMIHLFYALGGVIPNARAALRLLTAEISRSAP